MVHAEESPSQGLGQLRELCEGLIHDLLDLQGLFELIMGKSMTNPFLATEFERETGLTIGAWAPALRNLVSELDSIIDIVKQVEEHKEKANQTLSELWPALDRASSVSERQILAMRRLEVLLHQMPRRAVIPSLADREILVAAPEYEEKVRKVIEGFQRLTEWMRQR